MARRLYEEMRQGAKSLTRDARPINALEPWKSPDAERLDQCSLADAIAALEVGDLGKRGLAVQFTHNMGLEPARLSYLGVLAVLKGHGLEKYWTETEVFVCQGGNQRLADRLAEGLGADRLHLRLPIVEIRNRAAGMAARAADGRWHEADDVVLAVPPSVWHKVIIDPPLPANLRPQVGMSVKYLAAMKQRYWLMAHLQPTGLSDGALGMVWEATYKQPGGVGAAL
jgi:monoamine oxidase